MRSQLAAEDREAVEAERGYAIRGEREVRLREWLSLREEGEKPGDFKKLVWRLRARKYWKNKEPASRARILAYRKQWAKDNRDRYREAVNQAKRKGRKLLHRPCYVRELEQKRARRLRERIERHAAAIFRCVVCGAEWCTALRIGLPKAFAPKYCMQRCRSRAAYLRARAAGKR